MGTVDISPSTEPQVSPGSRMAAPRLPEFMIGDFQMETSEGFNDYMYELGVNIVTRNIAKLEDNKLIKDQVPAASTGYHTTREVREFVEDGEIMKLHLQIPAKPDIKCERIYRRVKEVVEEEEGEKEEKAEEEAAKAVDG